ncbi:MAG TPA: hypothetical protein VF596_11835 [Pyrinomonadaceae bacterium]|jgi:hypothetical protein
MENVTGRLPIHLETQLRDLKENTEAETLEQNGIFPFPHPAPECFHGIAGEFVALVAPHTEAHPMALLIQFLTVFGSICGRSAFYQIESNRHHSNLFTVLVGQTGAARKGTSMGRVLDAFKGIDWDWEKNILSGLSSGEGLLYAVRDSQTKNGVVLDYGIEDKRALVYEGEFAGVLRAQGRDGNNLSVYIRNLWDSGDIRSLTKNSPLKATNAHVSMIGHITPNELKNTLTETESANGYVNRFLWCSVRRAQLLPFGGNLDSTDFFTLRQKLSNLVFIARGASRLFLSESAKNLWAKEYRRLELGRTGYLAQVTQRASPQTIRLAIIYALLDGSDIIDLPHLRAALAVWDYCEQSLRFIFRAATGDDFADKLLSALQQNAGGMTKSQIQHYFNRNKSAEKINAALSLLNEQGLADVSTERADGAKKDTQIWVAAFPQSADEEPDSG